MKNLGRDTNGGVTPVAPQAGGVGTAEVTGSEKV